MTERRHRQSYNEAGHAHHLTFCCYRHFKFLLAERTCNWLAESINEARAELSFDLWAYVFMPEHVHMVVHPRDSEYDIARIGKAIKSPVGRKAIKHLRAEAPDWIPKITRRRGKRLERLFWKSGGGHDRNIVYPRTLTRMIDYIHMNPVRRGLVERADAWWWSSAAWYVHRGEVPVAVDAIPAEWAEGPR